MIIPANEQLQIPILKRTCQLLFKGTIVLILLYFFICSLETLSSAFSLLGAKMMQNVITDSHFFQNSIVGLMIGIMVTVIMQSSSTSTSIVVTMVGSKSKHTLNFHLFIWSLHK